MAETKATKKRLSINLSFLTLTDPRKLTTAQKSPKNFEDPNGVVGLGILAALDNKNHHHHQDPIFISCNRASPKITSNPVPICSNKRRLSRINGSSENLGVESCEEYTCVISHVGENRVKKREYFEADFFRNSDAVVFYSKVGGCGGEVESFGIADFLSCCFMCKKMLHGLDIFMYRGEKAFCSADCRYRQMSIDEKKEKCRSGVRKKMEHSASPTLQFFAGVAAA